MPCKRQTKKGERCPDHEGQRVLEIVPRTTSFDPERLHPEIREFWDRYAGHVSPQRKPGFMLMCMTGDQAFRNFERVTAEEAVLADPVHGEDARKTNPAWRVFREAQAAFKAWEDHFDGYLSEGEKRSGLDKLRAM